MKKIAVIDLGTNGFRIQIAVVTTAQDADLASKGRFNVIYKESNDIQLANEGIHHISNESYERGLAIMRHFSKILKEYDVQVLKAFGTAALRVADNGKAFMDTVKNETGIEIELITGDREAELIYKGMRMSVPLNTHPDVMMDVGGGSVELIICNNQGLLWAKSFNVGVAILKQKFHFNDPILREEVVALENFLDEQLQEFLEKIEEFQPQIPIISSGTLDFIVHILRGGYEKPYLKMDKATFDFFYNKWLILSEQELASMPEISKEKVEMLAVSMIMMNWVINKMHVDHLIASDKSMKAGILYEMSL